MKFWAAILQNSCCSNDANRKSYFLTLLLWHLPLDIISSNTNCLQLIFAAHVGLHHQLLFCFYL